MKFGAVSDISTIDFSLPQDHSETSKLLFKYGKTTDPLSFQVGFAKWDPKYLQGFYPKGVGKKQLEYYSKHVNCIEMNAFFYRIFPPEYVQKWQDRTPEHFTFCPKLPQVITQFRRLKNCEEQTTKFLASITHFKSSLGPCFIQMHQSFNPSKFDDLASFIETWPMDVPLALELRHSDWYNDETIAKQLYSLLEANDVSNIITDTAGRRDLMHMRLTNDTAFIRFTGTNDPTDYKRIDEWLERIKKWQKDGLRHLYFFIHQHEGHKSMALYNHFIKGVNVLGAKLPEV